MVGVPLSVVVAFPLSPPIVNGDLEKRQFMISTTKPEFCTHVRSVRTNFPASVT